MQKKITAGSEKETKEQFSEFPNRVQLLMSYAARTHKVLKRLPMKMKASKKR